MDTKPTEQALLDMAENLEEEARKMRRYAADLADKKDFNVAGWAINSIVNLLGNMRLDLLVIRPVREYENAVFQAQRAAATDAAKAQAE